MIVISARIFAAEHLPVKQTFVANHRSMSIALVHAIYKGSKEPFEDECYDETLTLLRSSHCLS